MIRSAMLGHLRANAVAYVALFMALGGTSYAAVQLKAGSVRTAALANGAVSHTKLGRNSVTSLNVANGSLTPADFKAGSVVNGTVRGPAGALGPQGPAGVAGAQGSPGPQGTPGGASVGVRARSSGSVTAPKGASTPVPLSGNTWTQSDNELDLVAGTMTVQVPSSCTGSFGNALVVSVDGTPTTFAAAPTAPAGGTVTVPFVVGTLSEPSQSTPHTVTTSFGNSCTKDGESYTVTNAKLDVIRVP